MLNLGLHLTLVRLASFFHGQWLMKRLISDCEHSAIDGMSITNFYPPRLKELCGNRDRKDVRARGWEGVLWNSVFFWTVCGY